MIDVNVIAYLDDILIYSDDPKSHSKHVQEVLHWLQKHKLFANTKKCKWNVDTVEYLGYIMSPSGLTMATKKVKTIIDWPTPQKVKDIQSFLSFANFYHCFIFNYSEIVLPPTHLKRCGMELDNKLSRSF